MFKHPIGDARKSTVDSPLQLVLIEGAFPLAAVFCSATLPRAAHSRLMRRRYVIALVLLIMAAGIAFVLGSIAEPSYQGKRLSGWLRDLRNPSPLVQCRAQEALRQIGTNAMPVLRRMLHAEDSSVRTNLVNLLQRQTLIKLSFANARERRIRAAFACVILGPKARAAIDDLLEFSLDDSFCSNLAESALGSMGEGAVGPLCLTLTDTNLNYTLRRVAVGALVSIGPQARAATSVLTNCLADNFSVIRANAARALGRIGDPSPDVVRALVALLGDPDLDVRVCAEVAVTEFGNAAVPILRILCKDPDPSICQGAAKALEEITTPNARSNTFETRQPGKRHQPLNRPESVPGPEPNGA
jgi:HEAT repeat protein